MSIEIPVFPVLNGAYSKLSPELKKKKKKRRNSRFQIEGIK